MPLEPRAAVAEWEGDKLTVWTGTQRPFGVRSELSGTSASPRTGAGASCPIPGRATAASTPATRRSKPRGSPRPSGKPVKRNWTREEEMTWAYFRPGGVDRCRRARSAPDGTITEWEFHNYNSGPLGAAIAVRDREEEGAAPSRRNRRCGRDRIAGWRRPRITSCASRYMDELAHSAKMDPLEFRLKNAKDERLRNVIVAAAEKFGWKERKKAPGRGFGIAAGFEKGGYVATCAEVGGHATAP